MGLLDSLEGLAGGAMGGGQNANVAQALAQTVEQHGGIGSILSGFRQNGMDQHVNSWTNPATPNQSITPQQVQQGMGGDLLNEVAQKAGISPQVAQGVLATVLPMVVAHFSSQGAAR
ncbi:MAG TPA: YidB family protein [Acidisarcina sp.]